MAVSHWRLKLSLVKETLEKQQKREPLCVKILEISSVSPSALKTASSLCAFTGGATPLLCQSLEAEGWGGTLLLLKVPREEHLRLLSPDPVYAVAAWLGWV